MEKLLSTMKSSGSTLHTDKTLRMPSRPQPIGTTGKAFEDFGSSFVSKKPWPSSQKTPRFGSASTSNSKGKRDGTAPKPKLSLTGSILEHDLDDSESSDEMDMLSHSGDSPPPKKKNKEDEAIIVNGQSHACHPSFPADHNSTLKSLKFKKIKRTDSESINDKAEPIPSPSKAPISKENSIRRAPERTADTDRIFGGTDKSKPARTYANDRSFKKQASSSSLPLRDKSPNYDVPPSSPPRRRQKRPLEEAQERRDAKTPARPKPRPILRAGYGTSKLSDTNLPLSTGISRSGSTSIQKSSGRKPVAFPGETLSPLDSGKDAKVKEGGFPSISPLSSPMLGYEKNQGGFPPLSPLDATTVASTKPKPSSTLGRFPPMSPLSSQAVPANGRFHVAAKPKSKKGNASLFSENEDDADELTMTVDDGINTRGGLRPFPMSTQVLDSIQSSPSTPARAGPSRPKKRPSEGKGSESERGRKKRKEKDVLLAPLDSSDLDDEEEDSLFLDPSIDPKTLCPYCDTRLPSSPTPLLIRLLATTAKKSIRDPRPANPLGRKAPLAVFIGVCQRHRFESQTLPEAERKGWPKEIVWTELSGRVQNMKLELEALINDAGDGVGSDLEEGEEEDRKKGPKAKSIFWREVMKEVKKKGSRAVAGVRGQFANFEKTQPGYYGELGSVIIHQTLYNLFPPASFDPTLIAPLTSNEFIQRILVPEVGLRLIMTDKDLKGDAGMEIAVKILRESASYGVAMFPEDGGEWGSGAGGRQDEEMGVADLIVMERAKKRRKELEEEERKEEISNREQAEKEEKERTSKEKKKQKGKGKEQANDNEVSVSDPDYPKARPKPKPIIKGDTILLADNTDTKPARSRNGKEVEMTLIGTPKPMGRLANPFVGDLGVGDETDTRSTRRLGARAKKRRQPRGGAGGDTDVDLDLCSSTDAAESSDAKSEASNTSRPPRRTRRVLTRRCNILGEGEDEGTVQTPTTPVSKSEKHNNIRPGEKEEETPRPTRKANGSVGELSAAPASSSASFRPLLVARQKGTRGQEPEPPSRTFEITGDNGWVRNMAAPIDMSDDTDDVLPLDFSDTDIYVPRRRNRSHAWLLSDSSHSGSN